jgi:very-short-patch-repair endonuclease
MPDAADAVGMRLETDRKDLLDLSLRNPLLNYRPRSRSLETVGESPTEVYRMLVREGRAMTFLHDPSAEDEPSGEPPGPDQSRGLPQACTTDLKLQTALTENRLESRLLAIYYAARTSLEEQGVNTLFLALGMLAWYEADSSQKRLRAPLILVPVELQRTSARERFRLRHDGDDMGFNFSLAEKLRADFHITLPELPDADELDVEGYFDQVAEAAEVQARWVVEREAITLGFFSFGKFLMYLDLDEKSWPTEARPAAQPILQALLGTGFREPAPEIGDDESVDRHVATQKLTQVVDADSSQILALLDAQRGRNLVVQGPPGTGKSQTITNLIAEAVGQGKKVLFVAEKMAALEVVKRRLDAVGLGDACLELHSHKTRKKAVIAELRRTLELSRPRLGPCDDDLRLLDEIRDRLNEYCDAVNTEIGSSGVTPHRAFGELLRLGGGSGEPFIPRPDMPLMPSWSEYEFERRLTLVEQLQARLATAGAPRDHPFRGSQLSLLLPADLAQLRERLREAQAATAALCQALARFSEFLRQGTPRTRDESAILLRAAFYVPMGAQLQGADVRREEWHTRRADLEELLDAGVALSQVRQQYGKVLVPEAWDEDLRETRQDLNAYGRRWWRFLSGAYRRARRKMAGLCVATPPDGLDAQLALLDAVLEARRHGETVRRHDALAAQLFGARWQGDRSNWTALANLGKWIIQLHADVRSGRVPAAVLELLTQQRDTQVLESLALDVRHTLPRHQEEVLRALCAFLEIHEIARFGKGGIASLDFRDQAELVTLWSTRVDDLRHLVALNVVIESCRKEGLAEVVRLADAGGVPALKLTQSFRRWWFEALLEQAYRERPALAGFDGRGHEHFTEKFRALDQRVLLHTRARLAHDHWQGLPRHDGGGQLAALRREFEKKARHLPVRQLMARAGNAIQAIKPVFMMSPLSVASFLSPGCVQFDLVVFDEASQVRPVDAFGALLRGRQAVVVGDSRQLPPTSFFDQLIAGDDAEEDTEAARDVESILGLFRSQGARQRMLRWHYRSRHESLIAVSNHEFYDDRLVVFPSPDAERKETGLVFRHLPGTVYDRGKTRTNPGEAEAVAQAVMKFAREQLDQPPGQRLTLGVAAFSMAQMQAIIDQLERLRRDDSSSEDFFREGGEEPFFVKNLENVQGDERDVIYISVGYGRTAEGYLAMNFGPLNGDGGERRLNVLITRARRRSEVFTNLTADDIDLARTGARGVQALKTFLAYAQSGWLDIPTAGGAEPGSPFEEAVLADLTAAGHQVRTQVGSSGFRIDLAVVDPERPGRYLLGIECDGASYHSARSARDRDRLRQQVLEGLGWRIHRIWSSDWFRDPARELQRAIAAIEAARGADPSCPTPSTDAKVVEQSATRGHVQTAVASSEEAPSGRSADIPPYQVAMLNIDLGERDLHELPVARLAAWVAEVARMEGPVHGTEVARRIADAAGVKRIGNRIQAALDLAIDLAVRQETIRREGDFVWPAAVGLPVLRDRSGLPAAARKLDLVAPEELALAIERVVVDAYGMEPGAIPPAACRLIGFGRVSDEMRRRVASIVDQLVEEKRLVARGDHLVIPDLKVAS